MKLIAFLLLFPLLASAYQVEVIDPCTQEVVISETVNVEAAESINALDLSIEVFESNAVNYFLVESNWGNYISSILGQDAVTTEDEKYWGWSYFVNEVAPQVSADQYVLASEDVVVWKYGYSQAPDWGFNNEPYCNK